VGIVRKRKENNKFTWLIRDGEARFKKHVANKTTLFAPEQMYNFEQTKLEF